MPMPVAYAISIALEEAKIVTDMRPTKPLQYLPQRNTSPLEISRCANPDCTKTFTVAHGVAFFPGKTPISPIRAYISFAHLSASSGQFHASYAAPRDATLTIVVR